MSVSPSVDAVVRILSLLLCCRRMDTQLRFPTLLRHTIDAFDAKGFANITATYCVPLAPGRSRVFVRQPFRFKSKIPGLFMSALQFMLSII